MSCKKKVAPRALRIANHQVYLSHPISRGSCAPACQVSVTNYFKLSMYAIRDLISSSDKSEAGMPPAVIFSLG
jgi:hypothetical protein